MFAALAMSAIAGVILYLLISFCERKVVFWDEASQEEVYRLSSRGKVEREAV